MRPIPGLLTVAVACGTLACASSPTEPTRDVPGPETRQLVEALRSQGATVEVVDVFPERARTPTSRPSPCACG